MFPQGDTRLLGVWDRMQQLQVDFCLPFELAFYDRCSAWLEARSVLDVGSGNGYYIEQLSKRFPDKHYTGIDLSAPLVDIARNRPGSVAHTFQCTSLSNFDGSTEFDVVMLRLVLQHLDDIAQALEDCARHSAAGTTLIVIDAFDSFRAFDPPCDELAALFDAFRRHQASQLRNRDVGSAIERLLPSQTRWEFASREQLRISSHGERHRLFAENYALFIDLLEVGTTLDWDYPKVRDAWNRWCTIPWGCMQVGLDVVRLVAR